MEDPKAAEAKARGNAAFAEKDFATAIKHFTEAISHSTHHVFYSNRSACYASLGEYEKALEDGSECVKLKPDWPKGYARKGLAEFFLKRYDEAAETYKKGLELAPEDPSLKEGLQKVMDAKYDVSPAASSSDSAEDLFGKFDANSLTMAAARNPRVKEYMKDSKFMQRINALMGMSSAVGPLKEQMLVQLIQEDPRVLEAMAAAQGLLVTRGSDAQPPPAPAATPAAPTEASPPKAAEESSEQKQADKLKAEGNRLYKKRKFSEALEMYDKALERVPDDLTYHNNKCAVWMEMGEENYRRFSKPVKTLSPNATTSTPEIQEEHPSKKLRRCTSEWPLCLKSKRDLRRYNKALTEDNNKQTRNALREAERAKEKFEKARYLDPQKAEEHREKGNTFFKANRSALFL